MDECVSIFASSVFLWLNKFSKNCMSNVLYFFAILSSKYGGKEVTEIRYSEDEKIEYFGHVFFLNQHV